ncbi:glycoside hydrolase family 3 C-terminal domain-containing protein [Rhodocaloribacter litoris]|uniref:glycoside hydrolase family 3 N-terminal domain-containing protein n=1 Tax=Rhodocaloribacter litoris TaxID=2558931 RepID=UPI001E4A3A79|nr:glycoside hydrolase family 3 N-terminal domain-containing protein [Rhodocaloribacter litoris]QXD15450.1 glycoside hydrolase family 3 C-terminal domain-containing protein [Rhodocaloribacter litoris]
MYRGRPSEADRVVCSPSGTAGDEVLPFNPRHEAFAMRPPSIAYRSFCMIASAFLLTVVPVKAQVPAALTERVEELLKRMTLEEKVGQMTQLTLQAVARAQPAQGAGDRLVELDPEKLREVLVTYHVGSLLNVVDHAQPLAHWQRLITQIQDVATQATRLGIPVIYGIDAVHGANYLIGGTLFPHNIGLAATFDTSLAYRAGRITTFETRASGIPWNFAPVLDLGRQPLWPRFYETFGEDVLLASAMGAATIRGFQAVPPGGLAPVAACAKHYVGYSAPASGKDRTTALIPERTLREYFLPPFRAAVEAGVKTVMVNSGDVNGIPVHASRYLLTDVLRGELGFEGVVVTDWEDIVKLHTVHRTAASIKEATRQALEAGIDMSMTPYDVRFYHDVLALVREGVLSEERIDDSVRRILRLKFELGLFRDPYPPAVPEAAIHTADFEATALEVARRSLTLLENEGDLLPLRPGSRVLVTGPAAHSLTALNGGWTYTWQGRDASLFPGKPTLLEALRERLGEERVVYVPGTTFDAVLDLEAAAAVARTVDVAVVAVGEDAYAEKPGDLDDLALPEAQRALVQAVTATGTPVVLVLVEGRPRLLGRAADAATAVLMAYWPGMEGGRAIAEVLAGDANPSGKLPFTYPRHPHDLLPYDHPVSSSFNIWLNEQTAFRPQWPFGHGLSYTTFSYEDLRVERSTLSLTDTLYVHVTVRNTGDRAGWETVLLFVADEYASVAPPVRRLRAFRPVHLEPGQARPVTFSVPVHDLAFVGPENTRVVEPGTFRVEVGPLSDRFEVRE